MYVCTYIEKYKKQCSNINIPDLQLKKKQRKFNIIGFCTSIGGYCR